MNLCRNLRGGACLLYPLISAKDQNSETKTGASKNIVFDMSTNVSINMHKKGIYVLDDNLYFLDENMYVLDDNMYVLGGEQVNVYLPLLACNS